MEYGYTIVESLRRQMNSTSAMENRNQQVQINRMRFDFQVEDLDKFSFVLRELGLVREEKDRMEFDVLKNRATILTNRMTYLSEALTVGEIDEVNRCLQIRTKLPAKLEYPFGYYEIQLGVNRKATMMRWEYSKPGVQRFRTTFCTTDDVLTRVIDDLVDLLRD